MNTEQIIMRPENPLSVDTNPEEYGELEYIGDTPAPIRGLLKFIESDNIAEGMDEQELNDIGAKVVEEFLVDEKSGETWRERNKEFLELAQQIKKDKTTPWPGAANVKLPLLADACIKFHARAYAEIVKDDGIVRVKIVGDDLDNMKAERGERVSEYMDYQLMEGVEEWEPDTDKLLLMLALSGHLYRKTYYDRSYGRMRTHILTPEEVHVNKSVSSLKSARRVSEIYNLHSSDLQSMVNAGCFIEQDLSDDTVEGEPDTDKYYKLIEQHRYLDLDNDGIEEPYMVTVHQDSRKVLCIKARYSQNDVILNKKQDKIVRFEAQQNYQDYIFIPSFDGSYLGMGLGVLLHPLNETSNTIFNQLLDAGTLSNMQSGFLSRSVKIKGGVTSFTPGEWKKTDSNAGDLRNGILPLPVREPSSTLFNLLGLVIELTKDIASIKDVLSGDSPGANIPATTVAMLVEQGLKTYSAIYKRIYRSLKGDFKILYRLNYEYLDEEEYFKVVDNTKVAYREDFQYQDCDISPVSSPSQSSDVQRMAQAQALLGALELPGVNPRPIVKQYLESVKARDIEEILPEEEGPDPQMMAMQAEMESKQAELQMKMQEVERKDQELQLKAQIEAQNLLIKQAEIELKDKELDYKSQKYLADAMKSIADAESKEDGTQIQAYKAVLDQNQREIERKDRIDERRERSVSAMGQSSGNAES